MKENRIIERQRIGCNWALIRPAGRGDYFYIKNMNVSGELCPMLHFSGVSRNYFKCRSLAIRMYDAFVAGLPKG